MVYILSGGPGFGKSSVLQILAQKGYRVCPEFARELIEHQSDCGGSLLPWLNPVEFERTILMKRIDFLTGVKPNQTAFADRSIVDQAAFSIYKGKRISDQIREALQVKYYANTVYLTPPWREIYRQEGIRSESFEDATRIHHVIRRVYQLLGFRVIDLPFTSPEERANFIIDTINNQINQTNEQS